MSVKTKNIYGKIVISDRTIEKFIARTPVDCYGIVEFVPKGVFDAVRSFLTFRPHNKGVRVKSSGDRINIDVSVVVKFGVSIKAVVESLKESIKYRVERFTGMLVDVININVAAVKL